MVVRIIVAGMLGAIIGLIAGVAFDRFAPRAYITTARFIVLVAPITGALAITFAACLTEAIRQYRVRRVSENPSPHAQLATDIGIYSLGSTVGGGLMAALFEFTLLSILLGMDGNLFLGLFVVILVGGFAAIPAGVIGGIFGLILGGLGWLADKVTGERFLFGIAGTSLAAALGALPVMLFFAIFNV